MPTYEQICRKLSHYTTTHTLDSYSKAINFLLTQIRLLTNEHDEFSPPNSQNRASRVNRSRSVTCFSCSKVESEGEGGNSFCKKLEE